MAKQETFEWRVAFSAANEIRQKLEPHCEPERIKIVGSLRRQCETVHDIDIVLQPLPSEYEEMRLFALQRDLGEPWQAAKGKWGMITGSYAGIPVDLYFATPDSWWTLVLVRTGSAEFNRFLASRAISMGLRLKANGQGVMRGSEIIARDSEKAIFESLGLPYLEPKDREMPLRGGLGR